MTRISTTTAVRRCSPGYGAPEQYSRGTNTGTDIYGLGATFYCLLTGLVPEDAFYRMTQLGSKGKDPLEPVYVLVPTIPLFISEAIQKAMSISSNDRFATVEQFWQALNAYPLEPAVSPSATTEVTPKDGEGVAPVSLAKRKTVVTSPVEGIPVATGRTTTRKRAFLPLLFVLAALAVGLGVAAAFWSYTGGHPALSPVATIVVQHRTTAATQPTSTPTSGVTPTATPHRAVPPVAPTSTPAYPQY